MALTGSSVGCIPPTGAIHGKPSAEIAQDTRTDTPSAAIAAMKTLPN